MDPFILSLLSYLTITLGVWAGLIVAVTGRIMWCAKRARGEVRGSDIITFLVMLIGTVGSFILIFIWPGLIHMIPSTVAFAEIGSIPIMVYFSELGLRQLIQLREKTKLEVDEHTYF